MRKATIISLAALIGLSPMASQAAVFVVPRAVYVPRVVTPRITPRVTPLTVPKVAPKPVTKPSAPLVTTPKAPTIPPTVTTPWYTSWLIWMGIMSTQDHDDEK